MRYLPKLKPDGIIMVDDYHSNWQGVIDAINELVSQNILSDVSIVGHNMAVCKAVAVAKPAAEQPATDTVYDKPAADKPKRTRRKQNK